MWIVLHTTTTQVIAAYNTTNHRLAIELDCGWLFLALEIIDYATFAPHNVVET